MTTLNREIILCIKMQKVIHGLVRSAILFYLKLRKDLEEFGFIVNDYDPYVVNKIVSRTKMTVVWHVDDLKISHVSVSWADIVKLLVYLGWKYEQNIMINHEKHDYLGLDFDFSSNGMVKLSMIKGIEQSSIISPKKLGRCVPPQLPNNF